MVSKIDDVIAEVEQAMQKLAGVKDQLREIKNDAQSVERARDNLRRPKPRK